MVSIRQLLSSVFISRLKYIVCLSGVIVHESKDFNRFDCVSESRGTQRQFLENICSEDDLRSRIFGTFVVKFLACLPLLGFSNIYKMQGHPTTIFGRISVRKTI